MNRALTLAAFSAAIFLLSMAAVHAQTVPAFSDASDPETEAKDKSWEADVAKACGHPQDKRKNTVADVQECQRLTDREPRCLTYKDFAGIYLQMRDNGSVLTDVAAGLAAMEKNTDLYPRDFFNAIRRLSQIVFLADRKGLGPGDQFAERAYRTCMTGHPL